MFHLSLFSYWIHNVYSALLDRMLNQWGISITIITIIMSFQFVVMIYQENNFSV